MKHIYLEKVREWVKWNIKWGGGKRKKRQFYNVYTISLPSDFIFLFFKVIRNHFVQRIKSRLIYFHSLPYCFSCLLSLFVQINNLLFVSKYLLGCFFNLCEVTDQIGSGQLGSHTWTNGQQMTLKKKTITWHKSRWVLKSGTR